jgi:pyruvate ferredoxin oxidoreductase beta subunit
MEIKSIRDLPTENLVTGGHLLCQGCGSSIGLRLALLALGKNTIVINAAGCLTLQPTYPYTPFKVPWIFEAIENAGAVACGIYHALKAQGKEKDVNILCYVGDGATYNIGLQSLSGACDLGINFIYVCYNNESFGNTGVQQSFATPSKALTTTTPQGNPFKRKQMAKIMAAHGIPYVTTACISYPLDFINKLKKACSLKGPKFIDLLCPCPTGWGFDPSETVKVGKLAVDCGIWPLYEIENGEFRLTFKPKELKPVKEYFSLQRRFRHLSEKDIDEIQERISRNWALLLEGKFWETEI